MSKRDTSAIEALHGHLAAARKIVRKEYESGASVEHIYNHLTSAEQEIGVRLKELQDWNKAQDEAPAAPTPTPLPVSFVEPPKKDAAGRKSK
jgi:hypothetical protein